MRLTTVVEAFTRCDGGPNSVGIEVRNDNE